jgi:hypothetical protein
MLANIVGMIGTFCIVAAYLLMQLNMLDPKGMNFNIINLLGAILLLISLSVHFNLPSVVIEVFWIAASLIGIFNIIRSKPR